VESVLSVSVEPLSLFTGLRVAAVCLSLLQSQTGFDEPIRLAQGGVVGADNAVGCHGRLVGSGGISSPRDRIVADRRQGSIPQPLQKFASIHGTELGGGAIVSAEVIPEGVLLRCLSSGAPANASILIGAVPEDLSKNGVHGGGGELREL